MQMQGDSTQHGGFITGVEPVRLTSPIARWTRMQQAIWNCPKMIRALKDPRNAPAKVAARARRGYLSPSTKMGLLNEGLPLGDRALNLLQMEFVKSQACLYAIEAQRVRLLSASHPRLTLCSCRRR